MARTFFDARQELLRPAVAPATDGGEPLTVSQIAREIGRVVKDGFAGSVTVRGELSNVADYRDRSGHVYFTLKDDAAQVGGVMWKSHATRLKFKPETGTEVVVRGRVDFYARQGKTQINAESMEPVGEGALELARRQLWVRLKGEGLFEADRKRALPAYPRRIAVVSSPKAAGFADILKVFRPFPFLRLFLYPVPVQGGSAAPAIVAALNHLGRRAGDVGGIDVVILARGGGSLEDLWAFNDEALCRAVAALPIPVVTGIGHETDSSVADWAADHHAHTPTEAAQVAVRGWRTAVQTVDLSGTQLRAGVRRAVQAARNRLAGVERHEVFRRPTDPVDRLRQRVDDAQQRLTIRATDRLRRAADRVNRLSAALQDRHPRHRAAVRRQQVDALAGRLARSAEAVRSANSSHVDRLDRALAAAVERRLRVAGDRLDRAGVRLERQHPRTRLPADRERLSGVAGELRQSLRAMLARAAGRVEVVDARLGALNPLAVLGRGYSITSDARTGRIVRRADEVRPGDRLTTRTAEGEVESVAADPRQPRLFDI